RCYECNCMSEVIICVFFFQAEDGIRDFHVTGVQTCALPISEATLEVVDKKVVDGRTAILYTIKATKTPEGECGSTNLITYVAEGPTALHTVELAIPEAQLTPERYKKWCDTLLRSRIE